MLSGRDDAGPVVMLHGLGRSPASLWPLARRLRVDGMSVFSPGYPSRRTGVDDAAASLAGAVKDLEDRYGSSVSFVSHSMGGPVALALVERHGVRAERIVMLTPPNRGSELADVAAGWRIGRAWFGPVLRELGIDGPDRVAPEGVQVGVIAGTRNRYPLTHRWVGRESDGVVAVERTRLAGAADWIGLQVGHTFPMFHGEVARQTVTFLRTGRFDHGHAPGPADGRRDHVGTTKAMKVTA